jgi:hypothetical protein
VGRRLRLSSEHQHQRKGYCRTNCPSEPDRCQYPTFAVVRHSVHRAPGVTVYRIGVRPLCYRAKDDESGARSFVRGPPHECSGWWGIEPHDILPGSKHSASELHPHNGLSEKAQAGAEAPLPWTGIWCTRCIAARGALALFIALGAGPRIVRGSDRGEARRPVHDPALHPHRAAAPRGRLVRGHPFLLDGNLILAPLLRYRQYNNAVTSRTPVPRDPNGSGHVHAMALSFFVPRNNRNLT